MKVDSNVMRRIFFCFVALLVAQPLFAAKAKLSLDFKEASEKLSSDLRALFSIPEGKVILVKGSKVLVDFGKVADKLKAGLVLTVYKPGKPIVDKETGQVFPGIDEPVGTFKVVSIKERYVWGDFKGKEVKKDYKIKFPEVVELDLDCSRVKDQEGLCETVKLSLLQEPKFSLSSKAEFVVQPYVLKDPVGRVFLVYQLLLKESGSLTDIVAFSQQVKQVKTVSTAMLLQSGEEALKKFSKFEGLLASRVFKEKYILITSGDFDRDGKDEIVLAANGRVDVYKLKGKEFVKFASYSLGRRGDFYRFLRVFTYDADGNGIPEIYVSSVFDDIVSGLYKPYADSFVLVYENGKLKRKDRFKFMLRLVEIGGKKYIIGQHLGEYDSYSGPIFRVTFNRGKYKVDNLLPDYIRKIGYIYGWSIGDLNGDGKEELAILDEGMLSIKTLNGTTIWDSEEPLGPFTHLYFYQTPRFVRIPAMKNFDPEEVAKRRMVPRKLDVVFFPAENRYGILTVANDEKKFVIAGIKIMTEHEGINGRVVKIEKVAEGTVYSSYFDIVWETPKYSTVYGQDFALGDYNGDGVLDLAFLGYLKKSGKTRVDLYKLPGM